MRFCVDFLWRSQLSRCASRDATAQSLCHISAYWDTLKSRKIMCKSLDYPRWVKDASSFLKKDPVPSRKVHSRGDPVYPSSTGLPVSKSTIEQRFIGLWHFYAWFVCFNVNSYFADVTIEWLAVKCGFIGELFSCRIRGNLTCPRLDPLGQVKYRGFYSWKMSPIKPANGNLSFDAKILPLLYLFEAILRMTWDSPVHFWSTYLPVLRTWCQYEYG